jgi:IclR family KDG regulon transcriptional repressor
MRKTPPSSFSDRRPANLVQAIARASVILDALGRHPRGISVRDLSATVHLPKGTTHRLLASLAHDGFVRQDAVTRDYFLGFKLVELGNLLIDQLDFRSVARPFLLDLADTTGETVHMVVLDQNEVVYIDKVDFAAKPRGLGMVSRIGLRIPAHSCAVGKIFLAQFSQDMLTAFIEEKGLAGRTENTITEPQKLEQHLALVRKHGYAVDDEENEKGIRCVAAPVLNEKGQVVAAISISGPTIRISRKMAQETLRQQVMQTAFEISRQLGYRD